jgi:hypothetical protein
MLEKPNLADERLVACLNDEFGLLVAQVSFLPLGADRHTGVYRIVADDGTPLSWPNNVVRHERRGAGQHRFG